MEFLQETYKHCKTIAATGAGAELIRACGSTNGAKDTERKEAVGDEGVIIAGDDQVGKIAGEFIRAIAQHRHWSREKTIDAAALRSGVIGNGEKNKNKVAIRY